MSNRINAIQSENHILLTLNKSNIDKLQSPMASITNNKKTEMNKTNATKGKLIVNTRDSKGSSETLYDVDSYTS